MNDKKKPNNQIDIDKKETTYKKSLNEMKKYNDIETYVDNILNAEGFRNKELCFNKLLNIINSLPE